MDRRGVQQPHINNILSHNSTFELVKKSEEHIFCVNFFTRFPFWYLSFSFASDFGAAIFRLLLNANYNIFIVQSWMCRVNVLLVSILGTKQCAVCSVSQLRRDSCDTVKLSTHLFFFFALCVFHSFAHFSKLPRILCEISVCRSWSLFFIAFYNRYSDLRNSSTFKYK